MKPARNSDLGTFTDKILNEKFRLLYSVEYDSYQAHS